MSAETEIKLKLATTAEQIAFHQGREAARSTLLAQLKEAAAELRDVAECKTLYRVEFDEYQDEYIAENPFMQDSIAAHNAAVTAIRAIAEGRE